MSSAKGVTWSRGSETCPRCGPCDGPWATIARREGQTVKIGRAHECGAILRWEREVELPGDLTDKEYMEFLDRHMPAGRRAD